LLRNSDPDPDPNTYTYTDTNTNTNTDTDSNSNSHNCIRTSMWYFVDSGKQCLWTYLCVRRRVYFTRNRTTLLERTFIDPVQCFNTYTYTYSYSYPNAYSYTNTNTNTDSDPNSDSDSDPNTDTDSSSHNCIRTSMWYFVDSGKQCLWAYLCVRRRVYFTRNRTTLLECTFSVTLPCIYPHPNTYSYPNSNSYPHPNANANANANTYPNTNTHNYTFRFCSLHHQN
jgi:hypothetical protein